MKQRIEFILITTLLFLFILPVCAQEVTIRGIVRDGKTKEPMIGVNVIVEGEKTGTMTNIDGQYSITLQDRNNKISFSYIGYDKITTKIDPNESTLNINLFENDQTISEVVVVGYGIQKKATITGSVDNINSDKLNMSFNSNLQNQLTGKLAGVRVIQKTSEPGSFNSSINIRGLGSPLIIIDGVTSTMDVFNRLTPSEIDNVSVLKDASAAIYGMKAGNGVLLVTTKKGSSETGKPQISYQGNLGFSTLENLTEPMTAYEYAIMKNEIRKYKLNPESPLYSDTQLEAIKNTDALNVYDAVMRQANPIQNHTINISGNVGEKYKTKYFLLGNYMKEYGLLKSGDLSYNKYNIRSNISTELGNGLTVDVNLSYVADNKEEPYGMSSIWKNIWLVQPVDEDGNVLTSLYANDDGVHYLTVKSTDGNPLPYSRIDDVGYVRKNTNTFRGQFTFNWDIPFIKGLNAKYLYTYEKNSNEYKDYRKGITFYSNGDLTPTSFNFPTDTKREFYGYSKNNMQASLNYETSILSRHNLKVLALYEQNDYYNPGNIAVVRNLDMDALDEISAGSTEKQYIGSSYPSILKNQALVGKLNYDYEGKYLFESSFRYDGSSQFAPGKRWGFFPSVSVGWRLSEEKFIKETSFLQFVDNIKIRGSYGILGDDSGASYDWISGYTYPSGSYIFDGTIVNGLTSKGIANKNLTWYTSKTANIGLDWSFWKGLFGGSTDIYERHREGLLATRVTSLPSTVGAVMPSENLNGDMTIGWELLLSHTNKIGKLSYSITANININRTKYLYIETARYGNSYDNWKNNMNNRWSDISWQHVILGQLTSEEQARYIALHQGTSQNALSGPGDYYHADLDGDGWVTEWGDLMPVSTNITPKITGGLTFNASYGGFDLSLSFNAATAYIVYYEEFLRNPEVFNGTVGALSFWTDRWHQDENGTWIAGKYPRYRAEWAYVPNVWDDSRRQKNASYIRLKNAEIGYSLPKKILKKVNLQECRIYTNGYNLLTLTGIKEMDPEYAGIDGGTAINQYVYPMSKNYSLGINVTF